MYFGVIYSMKVKTGIIIALHELQQQKGSLTNLWTSTQDTHSWQQHNNPPFIPSLIWKTAMVLHEGHTHRRHTKVDVFNGAKKKTWILSLTVSTTTDFLSVTQEDKSCTQFTGHSNRKREMRVSSQGRHTEASPSGYVTPRKIFKGSNSENIESTCPHIFLDLLKLKFQLWIDQECVVPRQFSSQLNTTEPVNRGLTRHTRIFQVDVLRQVGAELCRTVVLQVWVWTPLL